MNDNLQQMNQSDQEEDTHRSSTRSPQRHHDTTKVDMTQFISSFEQQQKYDLTASFAEDKEMYIKDEKTISKDPVEENCVARQDS